MQGEQLRTGVLQLPAPGLRVGVTAAPAESGLHGDGQAHGTGHGLDDPAGEIGITDQARSSALAGDLAHRAAHVDVDQERPSLFRPAGRFCHGVRAVIEQLHADRPLLLD